MRTSLLLLFALGCVEEPAAEAPKAEDTSAPSVPDVDRDGDGFPEEVDCDDSAADVNAAAPELCNGRDDDCDGAVDEGAVDAPTWFFDDDGDSFGDPSDPVVGCAAPQGAVENADDCDDLDALIKPGATELCNGVDDDCDGAADVGAIDESVFYDDVDDDGYGDPATAHSACFADDDDVALADDCDDSTDLANPSVPEVCRDGIDNDCDGSANSCGWRGEVLPSSAWVTYTGISATDRLGLGAASVDLEGDGQRDLLLVSRDHGGVTYEAGAIYGLRAPAAGGEALSEALVRYAGEGADGQAGVDGGLWVGDSDDDGYDDILVRGRAPSGAGRAYLVRGPHLGPANLGASPLIVEGVLNDSGALGEGALADIDADGVVELLLVRPAAGDALVVPGLLDGVRDIDDAEASLYLTGGTVGRRVRAQDDFDGDGFHDVVLQGLGSGAVGEVLVFAGPVDGDRLPGDAVARRTGLGLGLSTLGAGDLDGDGYDDLLLSSSALVGGLLSVLPGPVTGSSGGALLEVIGDDAEHAVGGWAASVGDSDGDGQSDLLVPMTGPSPVVLFFRSPGEGTLRADDSDARFLSGAERGYSVGDLNGDGLAELLMSAPSGAGEVRLFLGGAI
ncbi:MAG: hypothetical protein RL071_4599 [Pseudomonadota bacterium]